MKPNESTRENWWRFGALRRRYVTRYRVLPRYIATPEIAKHRVFVWLAPSRSAKNLIVIARADDANFGILHSRFHELWSLRLGTSLEDRPRYTSSTTFETFPFPAGLTPRDTAPVAGQASPPCLAGADRRREHRRRRPPPQRTARSLAQPGRVGRLGHHPGRGKSRLPQTPGRQTRPRSRPQEAHPDQPLQRPPRLARPRPQAARPGRRHRLQLARLLSGNARRRNPPPPAGAESGNRYLADIVNHSKHRSVVQTPSSVDATGCDTQPHGLKFAAFAYDDRAYPARWAYPVMESEYNRQSALITSIESSNNSGARSC